MDALRASLALFTGSWYLARRCFPAIIMETVLETHKNHLPGTAAKKGPNPI